MFLFLKAIGFLFVFLFFFGHITWHAKALVPQPGTEPPPAVVEVRRLTQGAAEEVPTGVVESKPTAHNNCDM